MTLFFQNFWHIVGQDVTNAVLDCLHFGKMLRSINFTHIVLIPKMTSPYCMTQFHPINLCNMVYRIVSKVLANRFKNVFPYVISDNQSASVPGCLITDNVLLAFEVLHYMKNKRRGKIAHMAIKLHMSKAFDQVEWDYLKQMMLKLRFLERWVALIMECISSVTYSVMLNGEPKGYIKPSKELRQGDPLSPYLFLICAKGLTALIKQAEKYW